MKPWFEELKDRFEWEREALTKEGFFLIEEKKEKQKSIVFEGTVKVLEKEYSLKISYPNGFPYFPPESFCTDDAFFDSQHILPINGKLCLLEDWEDNRNLTGKNILERSREWIYKTITKSFDPDEEIDGPEPKQYFLFNEYQRATLITPENVYKDEWLLKEGVFSVDLKRHNSLEPKRYFYKGTLNKINCDDKDFLIESELDFLNQNDPSYIGKYFVVDCAPPYFRSQNEIISWLESKGHKDVLSKCKNAARHISSKVLKQTTPILGPLLGIKYKDEIGEKGNFENQFLLVSLKFFRKINSQFIDLPFVIFQSEDISQKRLFKRSPELQPLKSKNILVLGLGTIGSSVAVDLAKAGVGHLKLIDKDIVSVGNINRQEFGLYHVGFSKPSVVESIITTHSPYTRTYSYLEDWGSNTNEDTITLRLRDVDLIVCAVGHTHTELFLNHICYQYNIPVIYAYCGEGAWSGRVMKVIPGETGCYYCHEKFIEEDSELTLTKPVGKTEIYDDGCATPAFTGSVIDTAIIANLTTRLAIQTVLQDNPDAYEQTENDHIVWKSQGNGGNLSLNQKKLGVHPDCGRCNQS